MARRALRVHLVEVNGIWVKDHEANYTGACNEKMLVVNVPFALK